jgi:hypothetical protein
VCVHRELIDFVLGSSVPLCTLCECVHRNLCAQGCGVCKAVICGACTCACWVVLCVCVVFVCASVSVHYGVCKSMNKCMAMHGYASVMCTLCIPVCGVYTHVWVCIAVYARACVVCMTVCIHVCESAHRREGVRVVHVNVGACMWCDCMCVNVCAHAWCLYAPV